MYALVRFLDDQDSRRHVISIKDILDFEPKGKTDFDNKAVYTVFWRDDLEENTGNYSAQILMLGGTEEEVRERTKRVPVPKVTVEESEGDEPSVQKRKQHLMPTTYQSISNGILVVLKECVPLLTKSLLEMLPNPFVMVVRAPLLQLHLQNGIFLTKVQASRVMTHKKPTLVVKETAQAIWTQSGLAVRSVKGGLAPRKKGTTEVAKPRLTPEKVQVVAATLDHWGHMNNYDASAAKKNLTNILSEKIQDCIKAQRRAQISEHE
ncbi:hypothetical protein HPB50_028428 [Hyalomma asiaticum]|nr:hypothetical protein HPB50_028428 [Hyalomma asiaticum]